jgi:hypothetical protein
LTLFNTGIDLDDLRADAEASTTNVSSPARTPHQDINAVKSQIRDAFANQVGDLLKEYELASGLGGMGSSLLGEIDDLEDG